MKEYAKLIGRHFKVAKGEITARVDRYFPSRNTLGGCKSESGILQVHLYEDIRARMPDGDYLVVAKDFDASNEIVIAEG